MYCRHGLAYSNDVCGRQRQLKYGEDLLACLPKFCNHKIPQTSVTHQEESTTTNFMCVCVGCIQLVSELKSSACCVPSEYKLSTMYTMPYNGVKASFWSSTAPKIKKHFKYQINKNADYQH